MPCANLTQTAAKERLGLEVQDLTKQLRSLRHLYDASKHSNEVAVVRDALSTMATALTGHQGKPDQVCVAVATTLPDLVNAQRAILYVRTNTTQHNTSRFYSHLRAQSNVGA